MKERLTKVVKPIVRFVDNYPDYSLVIVFSVVVAAYACYVIATARAVVR